LGLRRLLGRPERPAGGGRDARRRLPAAALPRRLPRPPARVRPLGPRPAPPVHRRVRPLRLPRPARARGLGALLPARLPLAVPALQHLGELADRQAGAALDALRRRRVGHRRAAARGVLAGVTLAEARPRLGGGFRVVVLDRGVANPYSRGLVGGL